MELNAELKWLGEVLANRLKSFFKQEPADIPLPPELGESDYANIIKQYRLEISERLVLILALAPHLRPDLLDGVIQQHLSSPGDFPQLGGARGQQFRGFLPTAQTAAFLLAGPDFNGQLATLQLFDPDHTFNRKQLLLLEAEKPGEPKMSGRLLVNPELVAELTTGKVPKPQLSMQFPAELLHTHLEWDDLVLAPDTQKRISELEAWVNHREVLMEKWGMKKWLKPGYRALFHGPPGTGKTLTASLLGKYTHRDVYRIDLSMVVSKYIGETEKNLAQLFTKAQNRSWILFFDEADALFGKRTSVRDAHDKYANQEVSYLLQRMEAYNGLIILASNFKSNIDEAFNRRFQSVIYFPLPKAAERLQLWQKAFPAAVQLDEAVDLQALSNKHEVSGANIMNVVQYACLQALARVNHTIRLSDLEEGIRREFEKEGKVS